MSRSLALCIDSRGGMMFNSRRQTRDKEVIEDLVALFRKGAIYIQQYSARLFEEYENIISCTDPVADCADGALCFVEDARILNDLSSFDTVVLYNWSIPYPADVYFSFDLESLGFKRISKDKLTTDIHTKVTREVFKRT